MSTKHAEFFVERVGSCKLTTQDEGVREADAVATMLTSAVATLTGNGWHYRSGKWVPPDEVAEEDRIIAARAQWLGLVLHPIVVSHAGDPGAPGGTQYEMRSVIATWTSRKGEPKTAAAQEYIHPNSLRDALSPDKLRHYYDNKLRNKVTEIAVRDYYEED